MRPGRSKQSRAALGQGLLPPQRIHTHRYLQPILQTLKPLQVGRVSDWWWQAAHKHVDPHQLDVHVADADSYLNFSSVQSLSRVRLFVTPWTAAHQASLSFTNSWGLLKLLSIKSVMPSNHLILCHPLLLLPSIFPSIRVFSNELALHQEAKVVELQHQSVQWIFRTDFFRMDWLDLLAIPGTLESSPTSQFKSINSSALSFL